MKYLKKNELHFCYFSSLSVAIAMGVKSTGVMALVGIFLMFLVLSRKDLRKILPWGMFLVGNFIVFSSYNYVLNFISYGNPLGSSGALLGHGFWGGIKGLVANYLRYITQFIDFSGFTWGFYTNKPIMNGLNNILAFLHIPINQGVNIKFEEINGFFTEQTVGYGILGFLVFLPAAFWAVVRSGWTKGKKALYLGLFGVLFFVNLLLLSRAVAYMVFSIRFICAFIVISSPVFALFYFKRMNFLKFIAVLFMVFYMGLSSLYLTQRPFLKLLDSYKKESSYKVFLNKTRCLAYDFYKADREGCATLSFAQSYYPDKKNIGVFANEGFLYYVVEMQSLLEKNTKNTFSPLLLNKINNYDLKQYDLLIMPSVTQDISQFRAEEAKINYKAGKNGTVYFSSDDSKPLCTYLTLHKENNILFEVKDKNNIAFIRCLIPTGYLGKQGFVASKRFVINQTSHPYDYTFWINTAK